MFLACSSNISISNNPVYYNKFLVIIIHIMMLTVTIIMILSIISMTIHNILVSNKTLSDKTYQQLYCCNIITFASIQNISISYFNYRENIIINIAKTLLEALLKNVKSKTVNNKYNSIIKTNKTSIEYISFIKMKAKSC